MKSGRGYLPDDAIFPFVGLDVVSPPTQLPPGGSPNTLNMSTFRGSLTKRLGYSQLGPVLGGGSEPIIQLINFQTPTGGTGLVGEITSINYLVACTATRVFYYLNNTWTEITRSGPVIALTKLTGGNGWSTTGAIPIGGYVVQDSSLAFGQWLLDDAGHYYIAVLGGVFDSTHRIAAVKTSSNGYVTLTGTESNALSHSIATFAILDTGTNIGWSITDGTFTIGDLVTQESSGATGIWVGVSGSNYQIIITSGSFDTTNPIDNTTSGRSGQLTNLNSGTGSSTTGSYINISTIRVPWHGDPSVFIDFVETVDINLGRVIVMVNGIDPPVYWNGTDSTIQLVPIDLSGFLTAKTVGVFNSYLVFANIRTQTDFEPRTAAWSDTGNIQSWNLGNSGVLAEMAFQGDIIRLIPFGGNLVVFSYNSIGCLCYVDPNVIFGSQIYVQGIKIVGPQAITGVNPFIIYGGQDNIYVWDGSRNVSAIGDRIAPIYRSLQSSEFGSRTKVFYDATIDQVRFFIPTSELDYRLFILEPVVSAGTFYDDQKAGKTRWLEHRYFDQPRSFGTYLNTTSGIETSINIVIGSNNGRVFIQTDEINDGIQIIPVIWDTGDFTVPQVYQSTFARWLELEFEAVGVSVDTSYSLDQGRTWISIATTQLTSLNAQYRVYFDITARYIRFRFSSSLVDSTFSIFWYRAWLRAGGAR